MAQPENQTDLSKFIKESNTDKLSSSRLLVLAWGLGTLIVWIVTSVISALNGEGLQSLPESIVTVLGILVGGKTLQRFGENER